MSEATAAGYVDLQVNGYAGVDFNGDDLTPEGLHAACEAMRRDGVAGALATVITEEAGAMARRLARIVELREKDPLAREVIRGLHVEGPFLNEQPGYRGAHPVDAIRPADAGVMKRLLEAGGGLVRLVTLAPERDAGLAVTKLLVKAGVTVSAGHCGPSLAELDAAIDAGVSMWTHLGNGCPSELPRHDNVIQRALSRSDRLTLCFIADGVHVPFVALGNYLKAAGARALVVTDAMPAAGLGPGTYRIGRWEIEVGEDLAAWAPNRAHLVGSAMTMAQAEKNLREGLGLSGAQTRALLCERPAAVLGTG